MRFLMRNFKICTAMPKWKFKENVSDNNGTLFSYVDLPSVLCTLWRYGESLIPDDEKHAFNGQSC